MKMLFFLAGAPVWAGLCCLYSKDRYHKEPWGMLLWSVVYGLFSTFVIYGLGVWLKRAFPHAEGPFYTAFIAASAVEEGTKLLFLYFLIYHNRHFDEPIDGAIYSGFLSLGFAWLENIAYVFHFSLGGVETALSRAILSVPCHGLFGVEMGYWLAKTHFQKKAYFPLCFLAPWALHGFYNYFLFLENPIFRLVYMGWVIFCWILAKYRLKILYNMKNLQQ